MLKKTNNSIQSIDKKKKNLDEEFRFPEHPSPKLSLNNSEIRSNDNKLEWNEIDGKRWNSICTSFSLVYHRCYRIWCTKNSTVIISGQKLKATKLRNLYSSTTQCTHDEYELRWRWWNLWQSYRKTAAVVLQLKITNYTNY